MEDRDLEDWELVDSTEARAQQEKARSLHHKKCEQEHRQAAEAHRALINAQQAAELGKLRANETCIDDVHRVCCIPGTATSIVGILLETPLVIRTKTEHRFGDGQNIIITGLSLKAGAPHSAASFLCELSRDHVARYVDECRLSLPGTAKCPCEPEEVEQFICLDNAEVKLSISSWGMGRTPITHSALQAIAQTAKASGLGCAIETALATVRTACGGLQHCAEALAGHLEHRQRLTDGSDALTQMSSALKNVSGARVPILEVSAKHQWDILREAVQPDHWISSRTCHECMECFKPLRSLRVERESREDSDGAGGTDWSSAHHCRHCGRVVCHNCAVVRECVPWRGEFQPVLVCKPCKPVVLLRNLCLQHLQSFNAQIELVAAGLSPPVEPKKGRGKGPPPIPPPPPKGKGRGTVPIKTGDAPRGRGLGALGEDIKDQLSELADFVVVPAGVSARPRAAISKPKEVIILTKHESLKWHVASKGYRPHLAEILRCLGSLELQDGSSDVWFDALEQILPLEEKLSEESLQKLQAVKPQDGEKLREYEQHIRLLLAVPELPMRWRTLRLLRDLRSEQEGFISKCAAIQAACAAPLVCNTDGMWVLRSEVKNVIAALHHGIQPSCERLQELVSRTQVGSGKLLLKKLWQAGEKHQYKDFDTRGFVHILAPVLLEGDAACAMQELIQRFLDLRKRHGELLSSCPTEELAHPQNLREALDSMMLTFRELEAQMIRCLELGGRCLVALGQWCEAKPMKSLAESAVLARAMDQNLQSLKNLTRGLQDAQPDDVKQTPAAKARSRSSLSTCKLPKAFKRKTAPEARRASKGTRPTKPSSDEEPTQRATGVQFHDAQDQERFGSSSEETCDSDKERPRRRRDRDFQTERLVGSITGHGDFSDAQATRSKGRKDDEKEVKRTLGFVVLRGETIVSLMAEAPPPSGPKKPDIQPGPGRGQVAGRGMPAAPLSSAPAGLAGPVRGVGGPAAIQMQPKAGAALPAPGGAPPGMPPGFPARPPGMPGMVPPGMPGMPPGMPPPGMPGMGRGMPPMGRGACLERLDQIKPLLLPLCPDLLVARGQCPVVSISMDLRPPPPPMGMSLAQQAQQLQSAKFMPAPKLPINMGGSPQMGGMGQQQPWQGGMPGGLGVGGMQTQPMSNGLQQSNMGMKGGMRPNWGSMPPQQQFGPGMQQNFSQPQMFPPQQPVGMRGPSAGSPGGLQRQNSYGNQGGQGVGPGSGLSSPGISQPQVVPPPPAGGPPPGMQYGQFGLPSQQRSRAGAPPPPPPHPNWKPGQPPPPPGPGPPERKPGGTLEAAMAAAAALGAAAPGMMEATSAIDFTAKLEDLRRKHPQVKVPSDAFTWKPEELEAWFASGGTSKTAPAPAPAAPAPPAEAQTPKKRSHSKAFGYEVEEALQLQQQLLTGFSDPEFQENLKKLQAQYPERKTKGHYDSMSYFEATGLGPQGLTVRWLTVLSVTAVLQDTLLCRCHWAAELFQLLLLRQEGDVEIGYAEGSFLGFPDRRVLLMQVPSACATDLWWLRCPIVSPKFYCLWKLAFNALAHSVYAKVLPDWKLAPTWDGVREMINKMSDALLHPKVKKVQEEISMMMGLPRNAQFVPPSKGSELFLYRPDGDAPGARSSLPLFQDEDGDEAHEFLIEDQETGELKVQTSSLKQEMWYVVVHKPAVMIREQPDEKAKMVGRKKAGKRLKVQHVKDGKWLQLDNSELVKLGVQEAWVLMDPVEAGLPPGQPLFALPVARGEEDRDGCNSQRRNAALQLQQAIDVNVLRAAGEMNRSLLFSQLASEIKKAAVQELVLKNMSGAVKFGAGCKDKFPEFLMLRGVATRQDSSAGQALRVALRKHLSSDAPAEGPMTLLAKWPGRDLECKTMFDVGQRLLLVHASAGTSGLTSMQLGLAPPKAKMSPDPAFPQYGLFTLMGQAEVPLLELLDRLDSQVLEEIYLPDSVTHSASPFYVHVLPTRNVESNHVRTFFNLHCDQTFKDLVSEHRSLLRPLKDRQPFGRTRGLAVDAYPPADRLEVVESFVCLRDGKDGHFVVSLRQTGKHLAWEAWAGYARRVQPAWEEVTDEALLEEQHIEQVDILRIHVLGREFDALRSAEKFLRAGKAEVKALAISVSKESIELEAQMLMRSGYILQLEGFANLDVQNIFRAQQQSLPQSVQTMIARYPR
ncbi:Small nuclear ribonucleoprotein-associated protein B [Symbiodinium microadriaticum]|uniref:Small nuclear ribonucleoprotein-associated protein B n=1 Tax=Symbiodinium microadriaticum TaxID=2951 RepID=A0A1Q9DBI6_SYMMI|nr:Small nuclear ribonucleoprotein-associated protein B [Symbiodinium microadriaticum]